MPYMYSMEPSLRSSSYRATECKLKRTEPALHETMQRFVESLAEDVRVSQYADINFAIKKFESKTWYWLTPIGRSGYLVCLPKMPVVWIDEQFKHSYKVQMRISSTIYEKGSVFVGSLNLADSLLRIEDVWLLSGNNLRDTPFTQRWNKLFEFLSVSYKQDSVLQQGLRIEPAVYEPLSSITEMLHMPNMMLAQGEHEKRRLRVQLQQNNTQTDVCRVDMSRPDITRQEAKKQDAKKQEAKKQEAKQLPPAPRPLPRIQKQSTANEAIAVAHPEYPDTYDVFIDGVKKGYAAVQDIELSKRLKACTSEIRVKIEWNSEFSMYEINDIL